MGEKEREWGKERGKECILKMQSRRKCYNKCEVRKEKEFNQICTSVRQQV